MPYGLRLLECLLAAGAEVHLMVSAPARLVLQQETDLPLPARPRDMAAALAERYPGAADHLQVYGKEDWAAPMASGSARVDAMVVCPCTTGTLAAVASGNSRNLIERAADVMLKERRPLILVPREMPLSVIHLENMLRLARAGAVIMPPSPGFYHHPETIADLVDFVVARILDHLDLPHQLMPRWGDGLGL
jgi:4-hydroxy-3-polyprenylbenzoate decarboxylase